MYVCACVYFFTHLHTLSLSLSISISISRYLINIVFLHIFLYHFFICLYLFSSIFISPLSHFNCLSCSISHSFSIYLSLSFMLSIFVFLFISIISYVILFRCNFSLPLSGSQSILFYFCLCVYIRHLEHISFFSFSLHLTHTLPNPGACTIKILRT